MSELDQKADELMRYWLRSVSSPAPAEVAGVILREHDDYRRLAAGWDCLAGAARWEAVAALETLVRRVAYDTRPYCLRCGTCCRNAGPTLHSGDEQAVSGGIIPLESLITLRRGARTRSHYEGCEITLEHEVVMIAPGADGNCPHLTGPPAACAIHADRPQQCRAQQCWDTSASDELNRKPGLTRLDLLPEGDPLRGVILDHEARFAVGADDSEFRERVVREYPEAAGMLDFLMGPAGGINKEQRTKNKE